MSDHSPVVRVEHRDTTALVIIDRPRALNAIDAQVLEELDAAIHQLPEGCRAVVITGAGDKAFVAGADIKAMQSMTPAESERFGQKGHALFARLGALPMPVIAAVNGFALGGGCELALACDFVVASETARFGLPEVGLGVIPGFGGTTRLGRRVGDAWARRMIVTGERVKAEVALRIGLVTEVVAPDRLLDRALELAGQIGANAPRAVALGKRSARVAEESSLEQANAFEVAAFGLCFSTEDQREGMSAFIEKREPVWKGS